MATTNLCLTTLALVNKTDDYVKHLEATHVNRLLARRRHSREAAREDERFQLRQQHLTRKARHDSVSQ